MNGAYWNHAAVSIRGKGHEQTGTPCQDACAVECSPDGRWLALAASDGAGSAIHSQISANLVAREFTVRLLSIARELNIRPPGAWVTDAVIEDIVFLRKALRQQAGSDNISDYHCTLVAALLGPSGGFSIHLGDGAVIAGSPAMVGQTTINLSEGLFVSEPENGEYANETVFLTERDWIRHLRIHPLPAVDWLVLGTDGGMALAMVDDKQPKTGFVLPLLRSLIGEDDPAARQAALVAALTDKQADRLTNDDKTLVIVVRASCADVTGSFTPPITVQQGSPPSIPVTGGKTGTVQPVQPPPLSAVRQQGTLTFPTSAPTEPIETKPASFLSRIDWPSWGLHAMLVLLAIVVLVVLVYVGSRWIGESPVRIASDKANTAKNSSAEVRKE